MENTMMHGKGKTVAVGHASPFIGAESLTKLDGIRTSLEKQGKKPKNYETNLRGCGSCAGWTSGKSICDGLYDS